MPRWLNLRLWRRDVDVDVLVDDRLHRAWWRAVLRRGLRRPVFRRHFRRTVVSRDLWRPVLCGQLRRPIFARGLRRAVVHRWPRRAVVHDRLPVARHHERRQLILGIEVLGGRHARWHHRQVRWKRRGGATFSVGAKRPAAARGKHTFRAGDQHNER